MGVRVPVIEGVTDAELVAVSDGVREAVTDGVDEGVPVFELVAVSDDVKDAVLDAVPETLDERVLVTVLVAVSEAVTDGVPVIVLVAVSDGVEDRVAVFEAVFDDVADDAGVGKLVVVVSFPPTALKTSRAAATIHNTFLLAILFLVVVVRKSLILSVWPGLSPTTSNPTNFVDGDDDAVFS